MSTHWNEKDLYLLGSSASIDIQLISGLSHDESRHVIRGLWDGKGFIGLNLGGYPVASLVVDSLDLAFWISERIWAVVGRYVPPRNLKSGLIWVGVSGRKCAPWLRYIYDQSNFVSVDKFSKAKELISMLEQGK